MSSKSSTPVDPANVSPTMRRIMADVQTVATQHSVKVRSVPRGAHLCLQIRSRMRLARRAGFVVGATVVGIYFYTMYAVQQETFLDNRNVPTPPVRSLKHRQDQQNQS